MLEYQSCRRLQSAARGVESNCVTPQLLNRFEFGTCNERAGGARHVTGQDSKRRSLDRGCDRISNYRPVIKFSADQCGECNGGINANDLTLKTILFKEASLFC